MARAYESWASSPAARAVAQGNRRRDTKPELALRRALHAMGLRYRVDVRPLPALNRRADIVFRRARVAVHVDGCYWHGCPEHGTTAKTNPGYWGPKIARNKERDAETDRLLAEDGWVSLRVWEHEEPARAAQRVVDVLRGRR